MTKQEFIRQFKTTTLLVSELNIDNKNLFNALTIISSEFDNGDLKNATKHLNEVTDSIIEIIE